MKLPIRASVPAALFLVPGLLAAQTAAETAAETSEAVAPADERSRAVKTLSMSYGFPRPISTNVPTIFRTW